MSGSKPLGLDLRGSTFTLGSFEGVVQSFNAEKNSFLVKFNGTDLLEVDATTVLNLLLQKESESKADEGPTYCSAIPSQTQQPPMLQSTSSSSRLHIHTPTQPLHRHDSITSLGIHQNIDQTSNSPLMNQANSIQNQSFMRLPNMYNYQNKVSNVLYPMTSSLNTQNPILQNMNQLNMPQQNIRQNYNPLYNQLPLHQMSGFQGLTPSNSINRLNKGRFQEGMTRHRSLSQPHLLTERVLRKSGLGHQRRRRDSLVARPRRRQSINHNLHENSKVLKEETINYTQIDTSIDNRNKYFTNTIQQQSALPLSTSSNSSVTVINQPQSNTAVNKKIISPSTDATKAEIFKLIRSFYVNVGSKTQNFPKYSDFEAKLKTTTHINATRLSTLRARNLIRKTLEPLKGNLTCVPEKYIVNCLINICPLCGASIFLNKLGSHINWFKHLISCHGEVGEIIVSRFEFFETNQDEKITTLRQFKDTSVIFKNVGYRKDSAPIEEKAKIPELVPFTTKVCLETLLLNSLLREGVFITKFILLQEVLVFTLLKYEIVDLFSLKNLFPEMLNFQLIMKDTSKEAFIYYTKSGHPNLLQSQNTIGVTVNSISELEKTVKNYCKKEIQVSDDVDLDWRVLLFNKALKENILTNCSILVQEVLVLAFFYFGFITQRTPKKFRIFGKLLEFFGGLYRISCKSYDHYVGEGPTGAAHTRGKPVSPSKEIIQNYNHYGLSRKSLQRTLAKEDKQIADGGVEVKIDNMRTCYGNSKTTDRRGSMKRKNSTHQIQSRRRRSSIKEYIPVVSQNIIQAQTSAHVQTQKYTPNVGVSQAIIQTTTQSQAQQQPQKYKPAIAISLSRPLSPGSCGESAETLRHTASPVPTPSV